MMLLLKSIRNYLRCLSGVKSPLGMLMYQIRTLRFRESFVPCLSCLNNVSKTLSVAIIALLLTACAGNTKKQVSANVESEQIEIPAEAAQKFSIAIQTLGSGKTEQAEKQLLEITKTYPQLSGPHANLGVIYAQKEEWKKAEASLNTAVQKNRKNAKAFNQLGYVYRQQGDFAQAEKAYLKAISIDPNFADAYLNMGILCDLYLGKMQRAVKYYNKYQALQAKPSRQVAGWLVDINRRIGAKAKSKSQVASGG